MFKDFFLLPTVLGLLIKYRKYRMYCLFFFFFFLLFHHKPLMTHPHLSVSVAYIFLQKKGITKNGYSPLSSNFSFDSCLVLLLVLIPSPCRASLHFQCTPSTDSKKNSFRLASKESHLPLSKVIRALSSSISLLIRFSVFVNSLQRRGRIRSLSLSLSVKKAVIHFSGERYYRSLNSISI